MGGKIVYDNGCNLCTGIIKFIKRRKNFSHFMFIPLASEEGRILLVQSGLKPNETDTVVYKTEKGVSIRSSAVINILKDLGRGWRLFYILILIPPSIRDFIYKLIAGNRYTFTGKGNSCEIDR